jgi:uncharacterized OB-fold protein
MTLPSSRLLPLATPTSAPFWDGLAARRLRMQHCKACDKWIFYPRSHCPLCLGRDLIWIDIPGRGAIHSWTVMRQAPTPYFTDDAPFVLVIVEVDEGPRLASRLVIDASIPVRTGDRVRAVFESADDGSTLLMFELDR